MKHGWQFVKSIIPGRKQGFWLGLPLQHTRTYTFSPLRRPVHTDDAAEDSDCGDGDWPPSKKVSIDVRIWDLLSKREEQFVLVDMAESFINTWLTRTLLGLTP